MFRFFRFFWFCSFFRFWFYGFWFYGFWFYGFWRSNKGAPYDLALRDNFVGHHF